MLRPFPLKRPPNKRMSCKVSYEATVSASKLKLKKLGPVSWKESRLGLTVISPQKSGMILVLAGGHTSSVEQKGSPIP